MSDISVLVSEDDGYPYIAGYINLSNNEVQVPVFSKGCRAIEIKSRKEFGFGFKELSFGEWLEFSEATVLNMKSDIKMQPLDIYCEKIMDMDPDSLLEDAKIKAFHCSSRGLPFNLVEWYVLIDNDKLYSFLDEDSITINDILEKFYFFGI